MKKAEKQEYVREYVIPILTLGIYKISKAKKN